MSSSTTETRAAGYTLIELVVVLAITGIMATLGIDAGSEMLRTAKVKAGGSEVAFALLRGRHNASAEHVNFFVVLSTNAANRVEFLQIVRDDGSGSLEIGTDVVVRTIQLDQAVYLGDGRGNTISLPLVEPGTYAMGFGPRGEGRHPVTGSLLSGFVNTTIATPERGGWVKFTAIEISPSGSIAWQMHREQV